MHAHERSRRAQDRRSLAIALALNVAFMAGEVAAAVLAGSLALLADAGHMLTDAAALGGALVASRLATRPARGRWTFGLGRVEILAAQANGVALLVVGVLVIYSAARRLASPPAVHGGIVVAVALAGIGVNLAATLVLSRADRRSLNVRGAFVHVATDLVSPDADCHGARRRLQRLLDDRFGLHHSTLQVDHVARREQDVRLGSLHH
ncbi:MAG: cation diffusion facilitator family transporter [Gaiellaceae bacterium]|jgi:cobalt-zinc-cadmium efflux system protein